MGYRTRDNERVERGIQRVIYTYEDGRVVTKFRITYADSAGKMHSKTIQSHRIKDARTALAEARSSVTSGKHIGPKDGQARFLAVADQWFAVKEGGWKRRTTRTNRWIIDSKLLPLHDLRMCDLDYNQVAKFRAALGRPKANGDKPAPSSIKRTMGVLSQILDYARKRRMIVENPCADLDKLKSRKPAQKMPTTEDVERLIAQLSLPTPARRDAKGRRLKERPADPRWSLLVETAAYTGLRAGELAGLQVRDLNWFERTIRVQRTVVAVPGEGLRLDTPKSEQSYRTVPGIDRDLMSRLRRYCAGFGPRDYVFGHWDDDGKSHCMHHGNAYRRVIKPAAEALGIEMTFHGLRHHYASLLIDLGLSPVEVAAHLGHYSPSLTLNTYAHLFEKDATDVGEMIAKRRIAARGKERTVRLLSSASRSDYP